MNLRIVVVLVMLGATFAAYWLALGALRAATLPVAAGDVLFVIGPAHAFRFGAAAILSALTLPFALRPLRAWFAQAAPPAQPVSRTANLVRAAILCVIYGVSLAFYFTAYSEFGTRGFTVHSPLGARAYRYDQIVRLEHLRPEGGQADRYAMVLDDGSWAYFDADCESVTPDEVLAIASLVATETRLPWTPGTR